MASFLARYPICFFILTCALRGVQCLHHMRVDHPAAGGLSDGWDPVADPAAVVQSGAARFTVLTPQLIRMECGAHWVDMASLTFVNRKLPVPAFTHKEEGGVLTIETDSLQLAFTLGSTQFTKGTLAITLTRHNNTVWHPGDSNDGQLHGTVRTLDGVNGSLELDCSKQTRSDLHCTEGLISRSGWVLVDDSARLLFTNDTKWPWYTKRVNAVPKHARLDIDHDPSPGGRCPSPGFGGFNIRTGVHIEDHMTLKTTMDAEQSQDWYFFGHGTDYAQALLDFTLLAGKVAVPPRFALGSIYSRYWAYSDRDMRDLVNAYQLHGMPLDILVTDMDWHKTFYKEADQGKKDQAGETMGWTGFTWDSALFPDPAGFLGWCKSRGLLNTLNLHPASGTQPWEENYEVMARACGIDPSTQKYVPFSLHNATYVDMFMQHMLKPREDEGINFWWLDWQQGETWDNMPVNPTFWLNYVFSTYPARWANGDRPLILHRWGGLGNHRYQVGFSGDVVPSWASLEFQVPFTHTAANVGYGFWSHDLGGHTEKTGSELYTRWIQWGAFSPMFRPHSTKQPTNHREFWLYPIENFNVMQTFITHRARMVPYIYSSAIALTRTGGVGIVRPLYYEWPTAEDSYTYTGQYVFGSDVVAAPITTAADSDTQMANKEVYVPPGEWIDWYWGQALTGPATVAVHATLGEMPLLVRRGAIIPLLPEEACTTHGGDTMPSFCRPLFGSAGWLPDALVLSAFPPSDGSNGTWVGTVLHEDSGVDAAYDTERSQIRLQQRTTVTDTARTREIEVAAVQGTYAGMPETRSYRFEFRHTSVPTAVTLTVGGKTVQVLRVKDQSAPGWWYDARALAVVVATGAHPLSSSLTASVRTDAWPTADLTLAGQTGRMARLHALKDKLDTQWDSTWDEHGRVYQEDYPSVVKGAQMVSSLDGTSDPAKALAEISAIADLWVAAGDEINAIKHCSLIATRGTSCLTEGIKAEVVAQLTTPMYA